MEEYRWTKHYLINERRLSVTRDLWLDVRTSVILCQRVENISYRDLKPLIKILYVLSNTTQKFFSENMFKGVIIK